MKNNKLNKILLIVSLIILSNPLKINALTKDETVYSTLNKDGSLFKTNVVNHLYNANENEIEDITKLKDILNINGNEKFTLENNNLKWNNKGKEIFYKGTIEKELPIKSTVKYYLDGKEQKEEDLKGKSGKIKIEIKFENTDKHEVYINGTKEIIYTPFVVTLGTVISNQNISNLEISNGKIVNTGNKNFVIGLSSPGLYESLNLDEFKNMDKITLTYETTGYKTNTFYIVATPKLIETSDLNVFKKLDNIYDNVDKLQDNMNKIEEGSNRILKELENNINKLSDSNYKAIDEETMNNIKSLAINGVNKKIEENKDSLKSQVISTLDSSESLNPNNIAYNTLNSLTNDSNITNAILQYTNSCNSNATDNFRNEVINKTASNDIVLLGIAKNLGYINDNTPIEYYESIAETIAFKLIEGCDSYNTSLKIATLELEGLKQTIPNIVYNAVVTSSTNTASQVSENVANNVANTFTKETINSLNTLKDAIESLNNGISTYNKEGINELSNYANTSKKYIYKLEKLTKLTDEYKGFGSDNVNTTTFVSVIK